MWQCPRSVCHAGKKVFILWFTVGWHWKQRILGLTFDLLAINNCTLGRKCMFTLVILLNSITRSMGTSFFNWWRFEFPKWRSPTSPFQRSYEVTIWRNGSDPPGNNPSDSPQLDCRAAKGPVNSWTTVAGVKSNLWIPGTLKLTASLHLKMDGWNTFSFPFGARPIFRGELAVCFMECNLLI